MSFSFDVREETSRQISGSRERQIAETAAILALSGQVCVRGAQRFEIYLYTESLPTARKLFFLLRKGFHIVADTGVRSNGGKNGRLYVVAVRGKDAAYQILKDCGFSFVDQPWDPDNPPQGLTFCRDITGRPEEARSFIKGAFLACGTMSDPGKSYHLEFACPSVDMALRIQNLLKEFSIDARILERKNCQVLYIKDGDQISDTLNVMEAHQSMMEFENIRIRKEMREAVNRQVNCETANIQKAASAAIQQIADIRYLQEHTNWEELPLGLREMAELRCRYPEATLKELGDAMTPPVGKSGVNHRLRRLKELADRLRHEEKE